MALRSLDNALPVTAERPKKVAKVAAPAELPRDTRVNDENSPAPPPPPKGPDQPVEYIASEDLEPLPDPETKFKSLLEDLSSKDWIKVCEALTDVRRFALYHSSLLLPVLNNVMLNIVKAIKNPRSALCKTSIMASGDIFSSFGHLLLSTSEDGAFDSLLLQLLLKASQDKKFVCEEADKALEVMAGFISPVPLLKKLQCYVNHTNLRVRAKAAVAISKCVPKMGVEILKEFGLATLLQVAAELLNDRLPEAREAARSIINSVFTGFSMDTEMKEEGSWQNFCASNLPPIACQSVAKIVSQ